MIWNITDARQQELQPELEKIERADPEFVLHQLRRLLGMAKAHLPFMTTDEATLLVKAFCGIQLIFADGTPTSYLPELIASHITEGFVQEPEANPLRLEMEEEGGNPEWEAGFQKLSAVKFAERLAKSLDPMQAYLLLVSVECFWISRKYEHGSKADLSRFFNIRDEPLKK